MTERKTFTCTICGAKCDDLTDHDRRYETICLECGPFVRDVRERITKIEHELVLDINRMMCNAGKKINSLNADMVAERRKARKL